MCIYSSWFGTEVEKYTWTAPQTPGCQPNWNWSQMTSCHGSCLLFSVLFCRDGRMLFDYLAEKHNVSWPELLTSYFFIAFPMPLVWTRSCFRGEMGGPKTLNSFSGFVRLAQILRTFTFCGELLRINGVARDSWIEPQECRRFYIYRDVWLLSFPSIAPLPLRYPADLRAVPSVPRHNRGAGPLSTLWERPSSPKHPVNGLTSAHTAEIQWAAGRTVK